MVIKEVGKAIQNTSSAFRQLMHSRWARELLRGGLKAGQAFNAGKLGQFAPRKDAVSMQIALPVLVFSKDNVDQFDF